MLRFFLFGGPQEARWVTLEELAALDVRGDEVERLFRYVADGGQVFPLSLLTYEGAPLPCTCS